jgi:hypothetical protein
MTAPGDDLRLCQHCLATKPAAEFRRRSPAGPARLRQCRPCHNRAERERRAGKRARREHRLTARALTRVKDERDNRRLEWLVGVLVREFGGMPGLVASWSAYHRRAMRAGGLAAVRCFQAIFRLLEYCESAQPDPGAMSDEEADRALLAHVEALIQQHPELALAAASELGWTVVPGDDPTPTRAG